MFPVRIIDKYNDVIAVDTIGNEYSIRRLVIKKDGHNKNYPPDSSLFKIVLVSPTKHMADKVAPGLVDIF